MANLGFVSSYKELDSVMCEIFMIIEAELGTIRKNESKRKSVAGSKNRRR